MHTYNSRNLPLEHIVKSGRNILHYKFVVKNTQAKPADKTSSKAADRWNDDEPVTRALDKELIEKIVKAVNSLGYPAIIDIVFENDDAGYTPLPIQIPILPIAIEAQRDIPQFIEGYIGSHNEEYVRKQTTALKKSGFPFESHLITKINLIKEQIRRELMFRYLSEAAKIADAGEGSNGYKWLEGLNIINNHYNLADLGQRPIHRGKLYSIMPTPPNMSTTNADYSRAIREFSEQVQIANDGSIYLMSTPGIHVIGLNPGKSPTEIARRAKFDELLADQIMNHDLFYQIIEKYLKKVPKAPKKPSQPGDPQ